MHCVVYTIREDVSHWEQMHCMKEKRSAGIGDVARGVTR
jgi:hypothetical protein